jgi:hypothetical protein
MKIKSFSAGLADGIDGAFRSLDEQAATLGKRVVIHNVTDTAYSDKDLLQHCAQPLIVRVITYSDN